MSSYINWLRDHISEIKGTFPEQFIQLRAKAFKGNTHMKLPEQIAFLQFALDTAISWIVDKKVLTEDEALALSKEGWNIFTELSNKQAERLKNEDPIKRFVEVLQTLITQGKVRIEDKDLPDPDRFIGGPQGDLVGYYDDHHLYLLPPALWHSLQRYCIAEGSYFSLSKSTFYRILKNRKLIETRGDQNTIDVRLRGEIKRVLKVIDRGICGIGVTKVTEGANA
jgi:hypothetical protein